MTSWISVGVSIFALVISVVTAWLTFFRKGQLLMTQPTVIFFGPDDDLHNKVYLRTLLYSTSRRGQVIESMHVKLERGETKQNFSIWVYGDKTLHRGSGLFIGHEGVAFNHHFLLPADGSNFIFLPGLYKLSIFAKLVNSKHANELYNLELRVSESQATGLEDQKSGLYFDWGPDQKRYHSHIRPKPEPRLLG